MEDRDPIEELLRIPALMDRRMRTMSDLGIAPGSPADLDDRTPLGQHTRTHASAALGNAIDHLKTWGAIYIQASVRPVFAHLTLIRSSIEAAATARYLLDASADQSVRIARGAGAAVGDLRERGRIEESVRRDGGDLVREGGETADARIAEIRRTAKLHDQPIHAAPSHTQLVTDFGPGEVTYRVLCAYAHGGVMVPLATSVRFAGAPSAGPDPDHLRRIRIEPDADMALQMTNFAVHYTSIGVQAMAVYLGHADEATAGT